MFHDLRSRGTGIASYKGVGTGNDFDGWEFHRATQVAAGSVVTPNYTWAHPTPTRMFWRPDKMVVEYNLSSPFLVGVNDGWCSNWKPLPSGAGVVVGTTPQCSAALAICWPVRQELANCRLCAGKQQHYLRVDGCTEKDIQLYCEGGSNVSWQTMPGHACSIGEHPLFSVKLNGAKGAAADAQCQQLCAKRADCVEWQLSKVSLDCWGYNIHNTPAANEAFDCGCRGGCDAPSPPQPPCPPDPPSPSPHGSFWTNLTESECWAHCDTDVRCNQAVYEENGDPPARLHPCP